MSDLITSAPVAGWYEDPYDDGQMRWWTGDEWSEHVAPMTPEAAAAAQAAEAADRSRDSESTAETTRGDAAVAAQADAVLAAQAEAARIRAQVDAARAEAERVEAERREAIRAEAARAEAASIAAAQADAARAEAARTEAARAEAARTREAQAAAARTDPPRPPSSDAAELLAQLAAAAAPSANEDQPEEHDGRAVHDLGGDPVAGQARTVADLHAARLAEQARQQEHRVTESRTESRTEEPTEEAVLERVLPPGVAAADAAPATWSASSQAPSVADLVIDPEIEPAVARASSSPIDAAPLIATPVTDQTPVIASRRSLREAAPIPELVIASEETEADAGGTAVSPTRPSREEHLASLMAAAEKQVELQRLAQAELQAEADRQRGEQLHGRSGGFGGGAAGTGSGSGPAGQTPSETGADATALPSEAPESPVLVPASTSTEIARAGMVPLPGADDPFWSTAVVTPTATAVFSDEPKGATTPSSWMLALSPLLGVALVLGAGVAAALAVPGMTVPALGLAALIAVLLPLAFVIADGRKLRSRGVATAPSALWWLLGPLVYLLVRAVRVRREGPRTWLPAAVHIGASLVAAAVVVAGSMSFLAPVISTVAEPLVATSMEQSLAADGESWQIDCDGRIPSLAAGTEFACPAVSGTDTREVTGTFTDDRGAFTYRLSAQD